MSADLSTTPTPQSDTSKWQIIYPVYIDQTHSQRTGRRISKEFAVPLPTSTELLQALKSLNVPFHFESEKRHPTTPRVKGRVRVQFKDDGDQLLDDKVDCKQTLLLLIAAQITASRAELALKTPQPATGTKVVKGKGKK